MNGINAENFDVMMRAFDYYSKSLTNLEESEEISESIPLLEDKVEKSLSEIELFKKIISSNDTPNIELFARRTNFIYSVLEYYKNELNDDIKELENSDNNKQNIQLLQKEIEEINKILQKL